MATQHPDNAFPPYWDENKHPFISVYQEINEAVTSFEDLGASEYMWDWEGKHADSAVIDRLFSEHFDYFSKNQLGLDKFLTFRIPNIWEEKGYNLLQAMTVILSGEDFARDLKFKSRPLFEVILPMTERAEQLMRIHKLFEKLAQFKNTDFTKKEPDNNDYIELIPLVESAESQLAAKELLKKYVELHEEHFGYRPKYIRAFLAGSDSALSSGFLSGILSNKVALARLYEFANESGIPVYPIFGYGSLLFRGGLAPNKESLDRFLAEFPGVRTVTVQSSFRYDHSKAEVKAAIEKLERELPNAKPRIISESDQKRLVSIAETSSSYYKTTLKSVVGDMDSIFKSVPKRRDRRQHIGLLAYSRSMGEQKLPRAITFTAGFYSIGVPPEFIGLGRTLKKIKHDNLELLKNIYPNMLDDLLYVGRFLNRDNLSKLSRQNSAWQQIQEDVAAVEEIFGIHFRPETKDEEEHQSLSSEIFLNRTRPGKELDELIGKAARLRKSLG